MQIANIIEQQETRQINMESFKCPICGNTNPLYLGIRSGQKYCRKCITFRGQEAVGDFIPTDNSEYTLRYELSSDQKRLSSQLIDNYKKVSIL